MHEDIEARASSDRPIEAEFRRHWKAHKDADGCESCGSTDKGSTVAIGADVVALCRTCAQRYRRAEMTTGSPAFPDIRGGAIEQRGDCPQTSHFPMLSSAASDIGRSVRLRRLGLPTV